MSEVQSTKVLYEWTSAAMFTIAGMILAVIPALLIAGWQRYAALGAILLIGIPFLNAYHFEIDRGRRSIFVRTLWLGLMERNSVTFRFSDVQEIKEDKSGDTYECVLRFSDGRRFRFTLDAGELRRLLSSPTDS